MFIYKEKKHIYLACYILWVLTTILYLYLFTYSSNFIIDFYWGNYNYYILLSILMFFILVITRKKIFFKFKIVKTINKIIIISLLILIALNQSFRIYNAFISNQKISITSVSNKLLKLENLEELDMLSDNYNIINNSYISKKSFLIRNYYKTSELIVDKKNNESYKLEIEYYELINMRHSKQLYIELKKLIIDKYIFDNSQLSNIYLNNYTFDNNIELFTINAPSLDYNIHLYFHKNKILYLIYNGNLTQEKLIDKILIEFKKPNRMGNHCDYLQNQKIS